MKLGEKIREARRKCGFSQEQLAEKMSVSRSAIAKWETDKGLPDVGNLKLLARLLNVSVDHLLDESETGEEPVIREVYRLSDYGYGCRKVQKERMLREKFPQAVIFPLLAQRMPDQLPRQPQAPDCRTDPVEQLREPDKAFYLMEREGRQFLVTVTDVYVEVRPLEVPPKGNRFHFRGWDLICCNYRLE